MKSAKLCVRMPSFVLKKKKDKNLLHIHVYTFYFTCIDYGKIPQKLATLAASREGSRLPGPRARRKTFS